MPALNLTVSDELSELEARVLDHLARTLRPGFCPSREELSRAAGLGGRGYRISRILESLEQKGFLRLAPGLFTGDHPAPPSGRASVSGRNRVGTDGRADRRQPAPPDGHPD